MRRDERIGYDVDVLCVMPKYIRQSPREIQSNGARTEKIVSVSCRGHTTIRREAGTGVQKQKGGVKLVDNGE